MLLVAALGLEVALPLEVAPLVLLEEALELTLPVLFSVAPLLEGLVQPFPSLLHHLRVQEALVIAPPLLLI